MKNWNEIKKEDLTVGCVVEFNNDDAVLIHNQDGELPVYGHIITDAGKGIVAHFYNHQSCRTPFVVESVQKDGTIILRSATMICDLKGDSIDGELSKHVNTMIDCLLVIDNEHNYPTLLRHYKNLYECIETHGGRIEKAGDSIEYNVELVGDFSHFSEIVTNMLETYIKKNHDYGNAFSEMYDELGINYGYGKIREKVNRIKTLKDGDAMVENESLEDALLDCANYCILTLMEYQKHKENGKG